MLRPKFQVTTLLASIVLSAAVFAQPLPMASRPENAGFSSERLERTRHVLEADVESKRVPGAVLIVVRNGKIVTMRSAIRYAPNKRR